MNNKDLSDVYVINQDNNFELVEPVSVNGDILMTHQIEEMPDVKIFRPEVERPVRLSEQVLEMRRKTLATKPLTQPNPFINRMPGEQPKGMMGISVPFRGARKIGLISEDFPFEDYQAYGMEPGWMLHPLTNLDTAINGRWLFWEESRNNNRVIKEALKQLDFRSKHTCVVKMLHHCIEQIEPNFINSENKWGAIHYFFDWLLWSLGHPSVPNFPQTKDYLKGAHTEFRRTAHNRLMVVFDIRLPLLYPADYFGMLLEELSDEQESYQFNTTIDEAQKWCEKHFKSQGSSCISDKELLLDPNAESGRLLLAASNYTTNAIGFTGNSWAAKATLINLYFFAPHLLYCKDRFYETTPNWKRVYEVADKVAKFKGCDEYKTKYQYSNESAQAFSPLILIEEVSNALPPADGLAASMNAFGGSSSNALPPADGLAASMNAFGGSSSNALPPADDLAASMNAFGGSSSNALPPADGLAASMNAFGGSSSNALPAADGLAASMNAFGGSSSNALPPADDLAASMNAFTPEKEPEILPTRQLLGSND